MFGKFFFILFTQSIVSSKDVLAATEEQVINAIDKWPLTGHSESKRNRISEEKKKETEYIN